MAFLDAALGRPLAIQGNVIRALILREVKTRFGSSGVGWIWLVLEPVVQCLALMLIYTVIRPRRSGFADVDVAEFLMTGIVPWLFYARTFTQVLHAVESNRALLVYPQVTPLDIAIARTALEAMLMYLLIAGLLVLRWFLLGDFAVADPLGGIAACAALSLMGLGFGLVIAAAGHYLPSLVMVFSYINRILYFSSGVFFSLSAIPAAFRPYVDWNPLLQGVEYARASYFEGVSTVILNLPLLVIAPFALLAAGVIAERATRKLAKEEAP